MHVEPKVVVLAGQRTGRVDPLAVEAGVSHKCLVPVQGQSLIWRVLDTIDQSLPASPIFVSIEPDAAINQEPTVARLRQAGRLQIVGARPNLVDSVREAAKISGFPLLVTTADNAMLTQQAIQLLVDTARTSGSEAILGMARKADIQAAHSGGKGRYYEFRDGGYSNCNVFWLGTQDSLRAAEAFRAGGQFLKIAGRMMDAFRLLNLLLYRSRLLSLDQGFGAVSRRLGITVSPLVFDDGRLAIDVDDARSKTMVEDLLRAREGQTR